MLPEDQELRQALVPLPHHREPGEAQEDDEDRGDQEGHLRTLPERALPRRYPGEDQG